MKNVILAASAILVFGACSNTPLETGAVFEVADTVYVNGDVFTVDSERPSAEAFAVKDGAFIYVGSDAGIRNFVGPDTQTVDLQGHFVVPGFQDAHIHPLEGASLRSFYGCRLEEVRQYSKNPEDWIDYIRECGERERPLEWVMGGGHMLSDLIALNRAPRAVLDEALPDTPAAMMEKSAHSFWVNSKALELAGIDADTVDPQGGIVIKDAETSEPVGILTDSAGDEISHFALRATPELQEARYQAILMSQDMMTSQGITSATNARVYWERGNLDPWLRAEEEGVLKTRSVMALWAYPHMEDDKQLAVLQSMYRDGKYEDGSLLRLSQVKIYADGTISNNSATVLKPYTRLVHPQHRHFGVEYFTEERMGKYIAELEKVGFDIHVHALGDRAARETLNAIEYASEQNTGEGFAPRHQLTHLAIVHPDDIDRFAELGATANIQINFDDADENGDNGVFEDVGLVDNTESLETPVLELAESGANVVLSSDWDVSYMSPLVSVQNMIRWYEEDIDRVDATAFAIKAYTLNAAYAMRHDDVTGSIEPGKYADFVILDQSLFEVPVDQMRQVSVLATYLNGERVYQKQD